MINTVLGKLEEKDLGLTLTHEHVAWSFDDKNAQVDTNLLFDNEDVKKVMLSNLVDYKNLGGKAFVDATPPGCGRSVTLLKEMSIASGLHIITNTGAFLDFGGSFIREEIHTQDENKISDQWIKEFNEGIDGTNIKPGFIKIALNSDEELSELEKKVVNAAAITSLATGMTIQAHIVYASKAKQVVEILEANKLPLHKFVWVHADAENVLEIMIELGKKGVFLELDTWQREKRYAPTLETMKKLIEHGLTNKILLSQDSGTYGFKDVPIYPCDIILTEFIPYCLENGITQEVLDKILISNPAAMLKIG